MSATESLASVDTICVDKTGTLTEGELRLAAVEFADDVDPAVGAAVLGRFAASAGNRNQTLETIAARYPGEPGQVAAEVPFSSEWKWSGVSLAGNGAGAGTFVLGAPDVLEEAGALVLPPGLAAQARRGDRGRAAASSPSAAAASRCPRTPRPARRRGSSRSRWSCWRRRCARTPRRRSPSCATRKST